MTNLIIKVRIRLTLRISRSLVFGNLALSVLRKILAI